jgi:hypothetical protein
VKSHGNKPGWTPHRTDKAIKAERVAGYLPHGISTTPGGIKKVVVQ